jgi:hypothetical protein
MIIQGSWALQPFPPSPHKRSSSTTSQSLFPATRSSNTKLLTQYDTPRQSAISLNMGLRSMLGKFSRKKKDGESEPEPKEEQETPIASSPVTKDPVQEQSPMASTSTNDQPKRPVPSPAVLSKSNPSPVRYGEDPKTRQVNVVQAMDRDETTQDRINRVKSGKMTEKEKAAFLETALSAGTATETRKPLRSGEDERKKKRGVASPFPSDSILRNFARGKNATTTAGTPQSKNSIDSQKKKQDYFEMVTNPDRFQRYKASSSSAVGGLSRISGSVSGDRKTSIPDIADLDLQGSNTAEPRPEFAQTPAPVAPDLGARLEAAAITNENLRKQQEEDRRKLSKQAEETRKIRMQEQAEIERKRLEEFARQEAEVQAEKDKEKEMIAREEDEKQMVELQRLEGLMKAQEDYWTRKLATERGAKQKPATPAPPAQATRSTPEDRAIEEKVVKLAAEKSFGGPNESNLLELAEQDREDGWVHNQEIIAQKAAEISGRKASLNDVQTEKNWMKDQTQHKADVDRLREQQLQRLKALNSPLPAPRAAAPPTAPPAFQESRGIPPSAPSAPARSLGNMLRSINDKGSTDKKEDLTNVGTGASVQSEVPPARKEPASEPAPSDRRLSISELTKRKKAPDASEKKEPKNPSWSTLLGNAKDSPVKQQKPKEVDPPKARTGPIRMQIPLGDDDDEDDDFAPKDKNMSISDVMKKTNTGTSSADQKENSKKWGVDMSRFM